MATCAPAGSFRSRPHARGGEPPQIHECKNVVLRRPHARGGEPPQNGDFGGFRKAVPTPVGVNHLGNRYPINKPAAVPTPVGVNRLGGKGKL